MTQSVLFAEPESDIAPVLLGAVVGFGGKKDSARASAITQRMFEAAALGRGYQIATNIECGEEFDVIVRMPTCRPVVVQIKAGAPDRRNPGCYTVRNCTRRGTYSPTAYDVLAVFLADRNQWVFYTRAELGNRSGTTYTAPDSRKMTRKKRSKRYGETVADRAPDNWELLDQVAESLPAA